MGLLSGTLDGESRVRIKQSTISACAFVAYAAMSIVLAVGVIYIQRSLQAERHSTDQHAEMTALAAELDESSDLLTERCRRYVATGDPRHLQEYWAEIEVTRRREHVLERLEVMGAPKEEFTLLERAKRQSDAIIPVETRAMRLVHEAKGIGQADMPPAVARHPLTPADQALSSEAKMATARRILFDVDAESDHGQIKGLIDEFQRRIDARSEAEMVQAQRRTGSAFAFLTTLPMIIPLGMGIILVAFQLLMGVPILRYIRTLQEHRGGEGAPSLHSQGTQELQELANALNRQFEVNESQRRDLAKANETLEKLATTDGLTGLKNRRAFNDALEHEFAATVRAGRTLSVAMIDVDRFKLFNDEFGHPEGDVVLREVAAALALAVRGGDLVARYGGEEFVMLLPDTDRQGACDVAERCRSAINRHGWSLRPITISVGVATYAPVQGEGFANEQMLVVAADRALYTSKAGGRDRVTHLSGLSEAA